MNRREFLGLTAGAVAMGGCCSLCGGGEKPRILFGACRGLKDVPLMKEVGYDFFESGVAAMFMPGMMPHKLNTKIVKNRVVIIGTYRRPRSSPIT